MHLHCRSRSAKNPELREARSTKRQEATSGGARVQLQSSGASSFGALGQLASAIGQCKWSCLGAEMEMEMS